MDDKWTILSRDMARENASDEVFLKSRISPESLFFAHQENRAAIVDGGNRITAIGVLWRTPVDGWFELGSLWVEPASRGTGLAHYISKRRLELLPRGAHCFTISHNPRVARLAVGHGFAEATEDDWMRLAPFEVTCGPCDRNVPDKLTCPHRARRNECRLFVL